MPVETLHLPIRGMSCDNCARSIQRKLAASPGVVKATVEFEGALATVEYDSDLVKPEVLANEVRRLGYEVAS
jgi:copper chaperone CopZ